ERRPGSTPERSRDPAWVERAALAVCQYDEHASLGRGSEGASERDVCKRRKRRRRHRGGGGRWLLDVDRLAARRREAPLVRAGKQIREDPIRERADTDGHVGQRG